jgi:hypothetical protein
MAKAKGTGGLLADYYTEQELADALGVNIRTTRNWRAKGEGPPCTFLGYSPRYRIDGVREWLLRREKRQPRDRDRKSANGEHITAT